MIYLVKVLRVVFFQNLIANNKSDLQIGQLKNNQNFKLTIIYKSLFHNCRRFIIGIIPKIIVNK